MKHLYLVLAMALLAVVNKPALAQDTKLLFQENQNKQRELLKYETDKNLNRIASENNVLGRNAKALKETIDKALSTCRTADEEVCGKELDKAKKQTSAYDDLTQGFSAVGGLTEQIGKESRAQQKITTGSGGIRAKVSKFFGRTPSKTGR